jgi:exodeoxyribonuclease VII large subunit
MDTTLSEAGRASGDVAGPGGAPAAVERANEAVGLKAFLDGVAARVKAVPAAWVRCELLTVKEAARFVRMEFIEHGPDGRKLAQVSGGCWPDVWRRILEAFAAVGLRPEAGAKVLVKLRPRLDVNFGFSVEVEDIDPSYSLGDLKAKAEAIRKHLKAAGLWDGNRRLRVPGDYLRVAVISPAGAAGLGDFRSTVDRLSRAGLVAFTFHEAPFQTPQAAVRIVDEMRAIYRAHQQAPFCALAIIRGGGAAADLAYLVDGKLAEAVCKMPMPVMTGIGHERDRNLLDEVACMPLDTPSKVAEHIRSAVVGAAQAADRAVGEIRAQVLLAASGLAKGVTEAETAIGRGVREGLRAAEREVRVALEHLRPDARTALEVAREAVSAAEASAMACARARRDAARAGLNGGTTEITRSAGEHLLAHERQVSRSLASAVAEPPRLLDAAARDVNDRVAEVVRSAGATLDEGERDVQRTLTLAEALDPTAVLAAGYAILRSPDGTPLASVALVAEAISVRAEMRDGTVTLRPERIETTAAVTPAQPAPAQKRTAQ